METKSYYRKSEYVDCNQEITDKSLCVNCCGIWATDTYFKGGYTRGRYDFYIIYLYKGEMTGHIDNVPFTLSEGQIIIIPPNKPYSYTNKRGKRIEYLWLHFSGYDAQQFLTRLGLPLSSATSVGVDKKIISAYEEMFDEFRHNDLHFEEIASSYLIKICVMFSRNILGNQNTLGKRNKLKVSVNYIDENYMHKIDISTLSKLEHLSPSRYRVVFKENFGVSPQEYITALRLTNACALLIGTSLSIKQIADSTGFPDQLYFSRIFAKKFKVSPTVYRNTNK